MTQWLRGLAVSGAAFQVCDLGHTCVTRLAVTNAPSVSDAYSILEPYSQPRLSSGLFHAVARLRDPQKKPRAKRGEVESMGMVAR